MTKQTGIGLDDGKLAMTHSRNAIIALAVAIILGLAFEGHADEGGKPRGEMLRDGSISKAVLHVEPNGENLLRPTGWRAIEQGYQAEGDAFLCDNGARERGRRGVMQRHRVEPAAGPADRRIGMEQVEGDNRDDRP